MDFRQLHHPAGVLAGLFLLLAAGGAAAQTFMKCQDADGKWHYGDTAARECAKSRITEIDQEGNRVQEIEAPVSEEELAARKAAEEKARAEQEAADKLQGELERLRAIYDDEDAIIRARDERLAHIDRTVAINDALIKQSQSALAKLKQRAASRDTNRGYGNADRGVHRRERCRTRTTRGCGGKI